ncbi:hypothetical protein OKA04_14985 [Luteolibacter flavescens]|uniref:F5/8 type C domain-containing protein n=1 Tax=Luteolibacter flavescens TaxID=1859460 RepID=A0ABT3FS30_9BACT|nr:hypothetical protein [Luteolibacter flavescens]MCW1886041.1 hypothetical protein [Luteolibacter flavescens]
MLGYQGIPLRSYTIERSTDLNGWTAIGTRSSDAVGWLDFTDAAPTMSRAFYRIVSH